MLTVAELLAPDAALRARDDFLAPEGAAAHLAHALPGRTIESGALVRAKYRIGESLRVVHRLTIDGEAVTATARLFRDGASVNAHRRSPESIHDAHHDAVWWLFPSDRRMTLGDVLQPRPELGGLLGLPGWRSSTVAEYAPERSLTLRADDVDDRTIGYVKRYAPETVDTALLARRYDAVADAFERCRSGVAIPRALGRDTTTLALSAVAGEQWRDVDHARQADVIANLGAAIARFHTLPVDGLARPFGRLRLPRVTNSAHLVGLARPELAGDLAVIADRLAATHPSDTSVLLHGDCHPKNILVDGTRLALIDLDQAGAGAAACDIASLLARLDHGVILGEHTSAAAVSLATAFLAGYSTVRPLPSPASMRWHHVAALVAERAIRAVNRVNVRSLSRLDELIAFTLQRSEDL